MSEISEQHRAVYVRTPKTGCRSTATWLITEYGFREACWFHEYLPLLEGREDWLWFTTVRDPYDRARSMWDWAIHMKPDLFPGLAEAVGGPEFMDWLHWLAYGRPDDIEDLAARWKWPDRKGVNVFKSQAAFLEPVLEQIWTFPFEFIPRNYTLLPFVRDDDTLLRFPHLNRATGLKDPGPRTSGKEALVRIWAPHDQVLYNSALVDPRPPKAR